MLEKYCRAGQATDDNMAHANCMLDTEDYKHTHTHTHTTYVTVPASPQQQRSHEHVSMLRYTHADCRAVSTTLTGMQATDQKCFSLHPDTTPPQPNHNVTPTHIEPEQYNP